VHSAKYRAFLLDAARSERICETEIKKSKISKTIYLAREATASEDYEKLKSKAKERAAKEIAKAKYKKAHEGLSAAEKATVGSLAEEAVKSETELMNQPVQDIFSADLKPYERAVNERVTGAILTQEEFDALVSFAFNVGVGGFSGSTLLKKINENKYKSGEAVEREKAIAAIVAGFAAWNKSGGQVLAGLTKRRKEEADCFVRGAMAELKALKEAATLKAHAAGRTRIL
jgi:lysozyme